MDGGRVERDAGPVTPELRSVAARQQGVVLTRQARALGVSETQLARLRADRALVPVRRGALADATVWEGLGARERHRALVVATVLLGEDDTAVLSHWAAAALHGLPLLGAWPAKVHVTTPQGGSTRASGLVVRHPAPLPETDVAVVDGYRVTTVARTVVDLTRRLDFAGGVVVADAALQRRLSTPGSWTPHSRPRRCGPASVKPAARSPSPTGPQSPRGRAGAGSSSTGSACPRRRYRSCCRTVPALSGGLTSCGGTSAR